MHDTIGSVYIRIPFTLSADELDSANLLTLTMRYDDGFIAYLNGTEVARANAPQTPQWDSTATAVNDDNAAILLNEFDISDQVDALVRDNILAIHGLNVSVGSSDFLSSVELAVAELTGTSPADPGASVYTGGSSLSETVHVSARVLVDGEWSALNEATYVFP